jgi:Zn-dependent protease with chaperone function
VLPPILLLLFQQVLFSLVKFEEPLGEEAALIATLVIVTAFLLSMPLLLRLFLGLKPLPLGPLRERLDGAARRLHFRYSNVLVWNTRHLFANAMVTGFIPWLRYIILTDRLVEELTPDEVEAVFGHEIGHIKHHHLLFYLTFFLASFLLLGLFWETIKEALPIEIRDTLRAMSGFGKLGLLAGYTLLVFGYLSRRCERQADLFGSNTVSTDVFISALEKVAAINGIPRDRPGNWLLSWQHPTIAQRIDFLERMRDHPAQIQRFHLSIRIMQLASLCLLAFLVWWFHDSFLPILMEL